MKRPRLMTFAAQVATVSAIAACGGSGGVSGPAGSIGLFLVPATGSFAQGTIGVFTATVSRSGGFSGAVTFSVEGAPAGVTVSVGTPGTSGNVTTSVISMTVGLTTPAASHVLTVRARGSGVGDATATYTLTVTGAAAQFVLVLLPPTLSIPAGGRDSLQVLIGRVNPFQGTVTTSLQNPPAGITATFNPPSTAGTNTQARMVINVAATVAPATYPIVVRGSATGQADATVTLQLTVTPGTGTGNVTLNLAPCFPPFTVLWVAGQNGTGAWTRLTGANNLYRFDVTAGKGGVAWVTTFANAPRLFVYFASQAELTAAPIVPCEVIGTKTVNVSVAGLVATEFTQITLGGGYVGPTAAVPNLPMTAVRDGVHDLIAYRYSFPPTLPQRAIIRRDQNIANGGAVALNFSAGTESFAASSALITVNGVLPADNVQLGMGYLTGAACDRSVLRLWAEGGPPGSLTSTTASGIPLVQQRPTDFHQMAATTTSDNLGTLIMGTPLFGGFSTNSAGRTTRLMFHTLANRTITFGAALTAPTITKLAAPYKRLEAMVTIPVDYQTSVTLDYGTLGGGPQVQVTATTAWLGAANAAVTVPDFTAVAGWNNAWPPTPDQNTPWSVTVTGTNITGTQCLENGFIRTARAIGNIS